MTWIKAPGAPGTARGSFTVAGYGGSGEYLGPLWPRVEHHGDGTATLWWNELQSVRGPLSPMPEPGPDETFPREMPGIAEHPPGAMKTARSLYVPGGEGQPVQWYLHPNAPDGITLTPDGWRLYVSEGMLAPEWAPDADAGPDPRDPDWMRGFPTVIPTTGEAGPRFDYRGSWEEGPWYIETAEGWQEIDPSARPFEGGPPCFAWSRGTLEQFPCEPNPDGSGLYSPGTGPYMGRTPADPYYPFLDPSSEWWGHPVVRMPPEPNPDATVPEPCPEGWTRDPEDLSSECFPDPNDPDNGAPGDELECPEGWELTPEGNCVRWTGGGPGDPADPEPVPCFDAETDREGTIDPETGECVPADPADPGNGAPAPGAPAGGLALALGAGLLFLLGGSDR